MKTYVRKPTACLCGNPGKYRKWGLWVCETCFEIESRIHNDPQFSDQLYQSNDTARDTLINHGSMSTKRGYSSIRHNCDELRKWRDDITQDRIIALLDVALRRWEGKQITIPFLD
jgi:hypothetical protein